MIKTVIGGVVAAVLLSTQAFAADDPSIKGQQRADIQAAMQTHIEEAMLDGKYVIFDAVEGGLYRLEMDNLHEGIVRKGEFFVSCADMRNANGDLFDLDFLVAEDNGEYRVIQSLIHKVNGDKRTYHVEN